MLELLTNIRSKLSDFFADKIVNNIKKLWNYSKFLTILLFSCALVTIFFYPVIKETICLIPYFEYPWSENDYLVKSSYIDRLEDIQKRFDSGFTNHAKILNDPDNIQDAWSYSQLLVAASPSIKDNKEHIEFLRSQIQQDRHCWCKFTEKADPCHMGVTGWVIRAYAFLNQKIPSELINFIVKQQHKGGWWALYEDANAKEKNASTFATALLVIALQEQLDRHLISDKKERSDVEKAVKDAANWLYSKGKSNTWIWKDYPKHSEYGKEMETLSGMAIYALNKSKFDGIEPVNEICLERFIKESVDVSDYEISAINIRINDGTHEEDDVIHKKLVWIGVAIKSCSADVSFYEKAKIRRFFTKSLFAKTNTPETKLKKIWELSEFSFLINTLLNNY